MTLAQEFAFCGSFRVHVVGSRGSERWVELRRGEDESRLLWFRSEQQFLQACDVVEELDEVGGDVRVWIAPGGRVAVGDFAP